MRNHPFPVHALLLGAFLTALCGCQPPPGDNRPETDPSTDTTGAQQGEPRGHEGATRDGPASLGVELATLIESAENRGPETEQLPVLDRLNEPERVSTEGRPNRHVPGQIDTLRTLHYDDVRVTVYEVSGGKEILQNVTVTGPSLTAPQGVQVGMSRSAVEDQLGQPDERDGAAYVYVGDGPMPTRFYIPFEGDTVDRMEWRFPID